MITSKETLLVNVETRCDDKIYVTLYNEKYFKFEFFDDHDVIYKVKNEDFHKEFKKLKNVKGDYNNSYVPINFKSETECLEFLTSIGINEV